MEIGQEPPERIVTADESAVNILTTYRLNGWGIRGARAHKKAKFVRGTRYVTPCCQNYTLMCSRLDTPFCQQYLWTGSSTATSRLAGTMAKNF